MLRRRVCLPIPHGVLVVVIGLAAAACDGPVTTDSVKASPTSPSGLGALPADSWIVRSSDLSLRERLSFPLLNGMFTITTRTGDRLTGTYVGEVTAPIPGRPTAMLTLEVTGGTGVFEGATGTLDAEGSGAFVGEGQFVLSSLHGVLSTTAEPAGFVFRATVVGTSALSCSAADRILLTLRGRATVARVGHVDVELSSEIGNTECFN
jgi:hypothetical protein